MSADTIIRVLAENKWSRIELLSDNGEFFVKKIIKDKLLAENEIRIVTSLSHPNIIPVKSFDLKLGQFFMPYIPSTLIDIVNCGPVDEKYVQIYFRQIISAIKYLHDNNISHRDIKLDNIVIQKNHCYLIDFGFSCKFEAGKKITKYVGSLKYVPPEILMKLPFDPIKADVWNLAVCIYTCLTGKFPTISRYNNIDGIVYPRNISPELKDLLRRMFIVNPKNRYHIDDIVEHNWVKTD